MVNIGDKVSRKPTELVRTPISNSSTKSYPGAKYLANNIGPSLPQIKGAAIPAA
jgi:hypothetical protein